MLQSASKLRRTLRAGGVCSPSHVFTHVAHALPVTQPATQPASQASPALYARRMAGLHLFRAFATDATGVAAEALKVSTTSDNKLTASKKLTVFVRRKGAAVDDSEVHEATPDMRIGILKKKIVEELKLTAPMDAITLLLDKGKGADGTDQLVKLNSKDTVEKALRDVVGDINIIVDVPSPAPPAAAFKAALLNAKLTDIEHGCQLIVLPNDAAGKEVHWPGIDSNTLFVRPIYKKLYEEELQAFSPAVLSAHRHKLLRGIPGIGKSSFGMYALWRQAIDGRNVLYEYPKGLGRDVSIYFGTGSDVYIVDGCEPGQPVSGPATLLISSPRGGGDAETSKRIYDEFEKYAIPIYLEEPTANEVELMGKTCFGLKDADMPTVREICSRRGNVVRYALAHTMGEAEHLDIAIRGQNVTSLRRLVRSLDEAVAVKDVSFRVIHYNVHNFKKVTYRWASPWVGEQVVALLQSQNHSDRFALLADMLAETRWLDMSANLFQDWCNMKMEIGGSFRIRRLGIGSTTGVGKGNAVKPRADEADFFQRADVLLGVNTSGGYGTLVIPRAVMTVPLSKATTHQLPDALQFGGKRYLAKAGYVTVDFIECINSRGTCCNATVSSKHDLPLLGADDSNGLLPIVQRLYPNEIWGKDSSPPVPFLWLVPPIIFDKSCAGEMKIAPQLPAPKAGASPKTLQKHADFASFCEIARLLASSVAQYAVEIPAPEIMPLVSEASLRDTIESLRATNRDLEKRLKDVVGTK